MLKITQKNITPVLLVMLLGFSFGYMATVLVPAVSGKIVCHTIHSPYTELPKGYGSPFTVLDAQKMLRIQATCDDVTNIATVTVGLGGADEYIYEYGYERIDGEWKRFSLTGDKRSGAWIIGSATAYLMRDSESIHEDNRFITYSCKKYGRSYKCGCRDGACSKPYWQLQEFNMPEQENALVPDADNFYAATPSSFEGSAGTEITLEGNGFSSDGNTIYIGDKVVKKDAVSSDGGTQITFTVPDDVGTGLKQTWIEREDGEKTQGPNFVITEDGVLAPKMNSISPVSGGYGTTITITGENFSTDSNDILYGYGVVYGVASPDGKTLTFDIEPLKDILSREALANIPSDSGITYPAYITVVNGGGISQEQQIFTIKL